MILDKNNNLFITLIIVINIILIFNACETNDIKANLGCTDPNACNYNPTADSDNNSCFFESECEDCQGNSIDTDGDGIGDCDESEGCTDPNACNFNPNVNDDDGSCEYPELGLDCDGNLPLVINEVLYDPSNNALDGDANANGAYVHDDDEFVELVNNSSNSYDISGFMFFDSEGLDSNTPAHVVPANTVLLPGKAFVLFGGGDINSFSGDFGGATIQVCSNQELNLNNSGDVLTIQDSNGNSLLTFDVEPLSNNPNESYTRNPDLTGDFIQHNDITDVLFSPGTKIDGSSF